MVLHLLKNIGLIQLLSDADFLDTKRGALEELRLTPRWLSFPRSKQLSCPIADVDALSSRTFSQALTLQQWGAEDPFAELDNDLLVIIRITHEQLERGAILSFPEKNFIFCTLFDIGQKISLQKLKPEAIVQEVSSLIHSLASKNPKAAVIVSAMRIEFLLQNKCKDRFHRTAIETLRILEHCILSVSVNWSHYNAQCISEKLEAVLNEIESSPLPHADEVLVKLRLLLLK